MGDFYSIGIVFTGIVILRDNVRVRIKEQEVFVFRKIWCAILRFAFLLYYQQQVYLRRSIQEWTK